MLPHPGKGLVALGLGTDLALFSVPVAAIPDNPQIRIITGVLRASQDTHKVQRGVSVRLLDVIRKTVASPPIDDREDRTASQGKQANLLARKDVGRVHRCISYVCGGAWWCVVVRRYAG